MHLDHLPGSFFGPSNLVDLLRHRAAHQGQDRAFTYLVDGETEEIHLTYQGLDRQARAAYPTKTAPITAIPKPRIQGAKVLRAKGAIAKYVNVGTHVRI